MPTDNEYLGLIQADVKEIHDRIMEDYGDIIGDDSIPVTQALTVLREANPSSVKAVVTNRGTHSFDLYEGGQFVARLARTQTWVSDLAGKLEITAQCDAGQSSSAAITTYTE